MFDNIHEAFLVLEESIELILQAIRGLAPGSADPLADPAALARAVAVGIMDAPQLRNNRFARGAVQTRIHNGASIAVDSQGRPLAEADRLANLNPDN